MSSLAETSPATSPRRSDLARQIGVISATVFMLIAAMVGTGLFGGTPVQDLQGGALDADASYLAPARPAFQIWSVIYLGLIAYAIWQALPQQRASERQRAMGWWIALTEVLNGLWLVMAQFTTLLLTVVMIVVLLIALGVSFRRAVVTRMPRGGVLDSALIDGVTGLHLGWVTLAAIANITAWLTFSGVRVDAPDVWGIAVLIVVGVIGLGIAWASRWWVAPGLAIAWGLVWIAVARFTGEPPSEPIATTALVGAAVVLLVPAVIAGLRLLRPEVD